MADQPPIPTKFDLETAKGIKDLTQRSNTNDSVVIRRLVGFALGVVKATGRIDFLFDNDVAQTVLQETASVANELAREALTQQQPVKYTPKTHVPKTDAALRKERQAALDQAASDMGLRIRVTKKRLPKADKV